MMNNIFAIFTLAAVASSAIVPQPRALSCEECIAEMHGIDRLVKAEALAIEVLGMMYIRSKTNHLTIKIF